MVLTTPTIDLSQYDLTDPITKLMLMTAIDLNDPHLTLKNFNKIVNHQPFLPRNVESANSNLPSFSTQTANIHYQDLINDVNQANHKAAFNMTRRMVYVTIQSLLRYLHQSDQLDTRNDVKQWHGQYFPESNSVLINYHDQKYYYIEILNEHVAIHADQSYETTPSQQCNVYQTDRQHANTLVQTILLNAMSQRFLPNLEAFNALKNLWIAQSQSIDLQKVDHTVESINPKLNPVFTQILKDSLTDRSPRHFNAKLTYRDLIDFYHEIQNHQLTTQTQKVQTWLFNDQHTTSSINDMLAVLKYYPDFHQTQQNITSVTTQSDPELKAVFDQFNTDRYFPKAKNYRYRAYRIASINRPTNSNDKHFIGVHGTGGVSIPTILCGGFKNHQQLRQDANANYVDTAQALGDGTYFAALNEASKALNYSNHRRGFLLVSDVTYHQPVTVHNYNFNPKQQPYDFVIGQKVGVQHNYSEYVAVDPQKQVQLKYLIEIIPVKKAG